MAAKRKRTTKRKRTSKRKRTTTTKKRKRSSTTKRKAVKRRRTRSAARRRSSSAAPKRKRTTKRKRATKRRATKRRGRLVVAGVTRTRERTGMARRTGAPRRRRRVAPHSYIPEAERFDPSKVDLSGLMGTPIDGSARGLHLVYSANDGGWVITQSGQLMRLGAEPTVFNDIGEAIKACWRNGLTTVAGSTALEPLT
jgi:hypothetical protein